MWHLFIDTVLSVQVLYQDVCVRLLNALPQLTYVAFIVSWLQHWPTGIQCQLCRMAFNDQSAINAHYDTSHSQQPRQVATYQYQCDLCDKRFASKNGRKLHAASAHGVGDVTKNKCNICGREFAQKSTLSRHIKQVHQSQ